MGDDLGALAAAGVSLHVEEPKASALRSSCDPQGQPVERMNRIARAPHRITRQLDRFHLCRHRRQHRLRFLTNDRLSYATMDAAAKDEMLPRLSLEVELVRIWPFLRIEVCRAQHAKDLGPLGDRELRAGSVSVGKFRRACSLAGVSIGVRRDVRPRQMRLCASLPRLSVRYADQLLLCARSRTRNLADCLDREHADSCIGPVELRLDCLPHRA